MERTAQKVFHPLLVSKTVHYQLLKSQMAEVYSHDEINPQNIN
jgi:hypothetical protein